MTAITYLIPLLLFAGFGVYYLRIYKKGKAAGGGMMAGFQATAHEKWTTVLQPGEQIANYGSGVMWRPAWQAMLASQVPVLRLFWPTKVFEMVVTDRGRMLMGVSGSLGGLSDPKAYDLSAVQVRNPVEEKPGLAMKLNPLYQAFGKDHKTFDVTLGLPEGPMRLYSVPGNFLAGIGQ